MAAQNSTPNQSTNSSTCAPATRQRITADHPLLRQLITQYVAGLPIHVANVQHSLDVGDLDPLRRLMHQLKGSGGSYGFPQITDAAGRAEASIREGCPMVQITLDVRTVIDVVRNTPGYELARESIQAEAA